MIANHQALTSQSLDQSIHAPRVVVLRADGNADPFRQLLATHRPRDDAEFCNELKTCALIQRGEMVRVRFADVLVGIQHVKLSEQTI